MFEPTTLLAIAVLSNLIVNLTLAWRDLRIIGRNYKVWDQEKELYEKRVKLLEAEVKSQNRILSKSGKLPAIVIGPHGLNVITQEQYDYLEKDDNEYKD